MNAPVTEPESRSVRWFAVLALVLAFAWSAAIRIHFTLADPAFRQTSAAHLLRTDPAFLYYVTERIVESGGAPPADLRADPNVEWPELTDLAAIETLGQEYVVAWTYLAAGKPMPLHLWAVWVMGLWSSLVAVGVFGAAWELSRRATWAAAAVLLWAAMLVNYRTLGFVLIREDFAFPWIAAHLWLALRAARTRAPLDFALAGVTLLASCAFWHAAQFVILIEALALLAWFLRSGQNPFAARHAWIALAAPAALSLAVPVLRAKHFAFSAPLLIGYALLYAAWLARSRRVGRAPLIAHTLAALGAFALAAKLLSQTLGGGLEDFSHVFQLLLAKLRYLGAPPSDPRSLPFDVRLLWQGPFRTADLSELAPRVAVGLAATAAGVALTLRDWTRAEGRASAAVAALFTLACLAASWLVERTAPLLGLASAVLAAWVLSQWRNRRVALSLAALACLAHGAHLVYLPSHYAIAWYQFPPSGRESAHVLKWIEDNVPQGEAVASDYSSSAAVLAFAHRPVLNQPKYETRRSRQRIEEFSNAIYSGAPAQLAQFLRDKRCRWLLVNRAFLGGNATDLGGILPADLPRLKDRALLAMMSEDPREHRRVGPFQLVYEAPRELQGRAYRVYRLD